MDEDGAVPPPITLAEVACAPRRRLHISWGLGNELHLVDLAGAAAAQGSSSSGDEGSTASDVQW